MLKEQRVDATELGELVQESSAQPNAEPFSGGSLMVGEQCGYADQNRVLVQERRSEDQCEEAHGSDSTSIDVRMIFIDVYMILQGGYSPSVSLLLKKIFKQRVHQIKIKKCDQTN